MDYLTIINIILGMVSVPVTAYMVQKNYAPVAKVIISFAICAIAALVSSYFAGKLNFQDISSSAAVIFAAAQGFYAAYGKKMSGGLEINWGNIENAITKDDSESEGK